MEKMKVMYVDDEEDIREIAAMSLELDPGIEVKTCASGVEAIKEAPIWRPDLILLDVMMPVLDGPEAFARLRQDQRTADVPVVFVTARTQSHDVDRYISLGAAGVIAKPFDPMTLAAEVKAFIA